MGKTSPAFTPTCDFIKVLVVYDDALAHLSKFHVVLIFMVLRGLGWLFWVIFLLPIEET